MEEIAYSVENTPERGGGSVEGSGGGSVEVNYVSNVNGSVPSVVMKRKRGRPKKLPIEAHSVLLSSSAPQMGFRSPNYIHPPLKRGRGRPSGSGIARLGFGEGQTFAYGEELKPHILQIYPGEDVHGRILSFAQSGNRAITVMSCTGPVARVSICSPGSAGGMIYEGLLEILTLNGTFTCGGPEGSYHRRGMLTASLAKPNGEVFGGCVSGPIIAGGPIQLVLCSFDQARRPSPSNMQFRNYPAPHMHNSTLTSTPVPLPPPPAVGQVTLTKASDNFQQAQQALFPSLKADQPDMTNAPVAKDYGVSSPPPSPQPTVDQPQSDIDAGVIEASFENENQVANTPDQ